MTKRTASFTGTDGATWPAVTKASGGTDAWTASYWGTTPPLSVVESLVTAINSNRTAFGFGINAIPSIYFNGVFDSGTDAAVFNVPTTAGTTLPNYSGVPIGPCILFVMSAHTAQHYHEIDIVNSTNQFRYPYTGKTLTYTRFADYGWTTTISSVLTYFRMTAWIVSNGDTTRAAGRVRVNACSAPGRTAYTTTSGNAGATTTAPLNGTLTVQTWHGHMVGIYGADDGGVGNWEAGVRTANMATTTDTTATSTVTLPSTLTKSNNRVLAFFGRALNASTITGATVANGKTSTVLSTSSNGSPTSAGAVALSPIGSTTDGTVRKASNSAAVTWATPGTTQFYGFGVEIVDSSTAQGDTFPSAANAYVPIGLLPANNATHADSTVSRGVEVTAAATPSNTYRYGLIARYCTHTDGKKYGIHFSNLDTSGTSGSGHYALRASYLIDGAGETTMGYYDIGTVAPAAFRYVACRAVQSTGGGIWLTMKAWMDGASEPAWPTSEATVSSKDTVNSAAQWAVLNVVDNGTVAQIIAGYAGQVAVMGSGSFPSDAVNSPVIVGSQMIGALTDLSIATGDATLTGSGTLTIPTPVNSLPNPYCITSIGTSNFVDGTLGGVSTGTVSVPIDKIYSIEVTRADRTDSTGLVGGGNVSVPASNIYSIEVATATRTDSTGLVGSGTVSASGTILTLASATLTDSTGLVGTGDLSPVVQGIALVTATRTDTTGLVGTGSLTAAQTALLPEAVTLTGTATGTASGTTFVLATTTLDATGTLDASGRPILVATSEFDATGPLTASGFAVAPTTSALTGTADLSGDPLQIGLASSTLVGTSTFENVASVRLLATSATLTGTSTGSSSGVAVILATTTLDGAGDTTGTGFISSVRVALDASSILDADATVVVDVASGLSGAGGIDVIGDTNSTVTLTHAVGSLVATAQRILVTSASLTGSSTLVADAVLVLVDTVEAAGQAGGTGTGIGVLVDTVTVTGTGTLVGAGTHYNVVSASAAGLGSLSCEATHINVVTATCDGQGSVEIAAALVTFASAAIVGSSALDLEYGVILEDAATLTAIGETIVAGRWVHYIPNTLRETSSIKIGNSLSSSTIPPLNRAQRNVEMYVSTRKAIVGSYTTIALDE